MTFTLFGTDFYWKYKLFGFWIGRLRNEEFNRSLFCVYWNNGELILEILFINRYSFY